MMMKGPNLCAFCGEKLEGMTFAVLGGGSVHADCMDEIQSTETACEYAEAYPRVLTDFIRYHMSDSFMDEFWAVFQDENQEDIERWATH